MIVGLFPELSAAGGVQRAGRLTAVALNLFAAKRSESCTFLSLNDPGDRQKLQVGSHEISFTGFGRAKQLFAAAAWGAAGRSPALVIALHPNLTPIVALTQLRCPKLRSVTFAHGIEVWEPLGLLRRKALQKCDLVVAPSAYTVAQLIRQQSLDASKVARLPWSLGPEFSPDSPQQAGDCALDGFPAGRVILAAGRWDAREAYKGVDHLIAAMPEVVAAAANAQLVIVGEGTDLPRLNRLANASSVARQIHFLPFLAPEKLRIAYQRADVFALPSRGEGFGLVFLEAMSCGKPVIGGAHGGTPDVIDEGVTGYLVEYGAVGALADRLRRLITDEPLRQQLGKAAQQRVLRDFTFDRFSADLAARLVSLLQAPR